MMKRKHSHSLGLFGHGGESYAIGPDQIDSRGLYFGPEHLAKDMEGSRKQCEADEKSFFPTGWTNQPFSEAGSPRWVKMQAVVSSGRSPLPAVIRLKRNPDPNISNKWLRVPPPEEWLNAGGDGTVVREDIQSFVYDQTLGVEPHVYVQSDRRLLRKFLEEVTILTFARIIYKHEPLLDKLTPSFGKPQQFMIADILEIVKELFAAEQYQQIRVRLDGRYGHIAQLILDLTTSFLANKNWNSHGAAVGASLCSISSLLAAGPKHLFHGNNWETFQPVGRTLGGQKHGDFMTKYVEYMVIQEETDIAGGSSSYFQHQKFRQNRHGDFITRVFAAQFPSPNCYPLPRPVKARTMDFGMHYRGITLLDGECKDSNFEGIEILLLNSLDQLTYNDRALSLHTSSTGMTLLRSEIVAGGIPGQIRVTYRHFPRYDLKPVSPFSDEPSNMPDEEKDMLVKPAYFFVEGSDKNKAKYIPLNSNPASRYISEEKLREQQQLCPVRYDNKQSDEAMIAWRNMRYEPRLYIRSIFNVIDVLVQQLVTTDFPTLEGNKNEAFSKCNDTDPTFWSNTEASFQSKRMIPDQNIFKYGREIFEMNQTQLENRYRLFYRENLQYMLSRKGHSPEFQKALEASIATHAEVDKVYSNTN